ncbi:MAG: V-type ATP synthase subunit D [Haloarculaceae archaeon]
MRQVKPTRKNLMELRDRIELAERGHDVLERKRDGLILEFSDLLEEHEAMQGDLSTAYDTAQRRADLVRATEGDVVMHSAARARSDHPAVSVTTRNLMGVAVPEIEYTTVEANVADRGYGFLGTSASLDEVAKAYEDLLKAVAAYAEIYQTLQLLIDEIERTVRRVNALEHTLLPDLRSRRDYVRRRLDEREREEKIKRIWLKEHVFEPEGERSEPYWRTEREPTDETEPTDESDREVRQPPPG